MVKETGVQSQVTSYLRLKKWYLKPPYLTLSIIRYGSRVKWSNPGKSVALSPTHRCSSYWKGSLRVTLDYGRLLYLYLQNRSIGIMVRVFANGPGDLQKIKKWYLIPLCLTFSIIIFTNPSAWAGYDTRSFF